MKQLYQTLKIFLGCSVGVFLGSCIFRYYDFKTHPGLYAMQPTPWYLTLDSGNSGDPDGGGGRRGADSHVDDPEEDE